MYLVVPTDYGVLEVNYPWFPVWMGMNPGLLEKLQAKLREAVVGRVLNEETLEMAHNLVLDQLCDTYPAFSGLREHLDSIRQVVPHDG